jgi:uncharacterized repeat protein (TIGR01451 family)
MWKKLLHNSLVCVLAAMVLTGGTAGKAAQLQEAAPIGQGTAHPGVRLVDANAPNSQTYVAEFGAWRFTTDPTGCERLEIEGALPMGAPGQVELPAAAALIGVPYTANPQLHLLQADYLDLPGRHRLCLALGRMTPTDAPIPPGADAEIAGALPNIPFPAATEPSAAAAGLEVLGSLRSQRVARLRFAAARYDPLSGQVQVAHTIRARVDLPGGARLAAARGEPAPGEGVFEPTLSANVLNYASARAWRGAPNAGPGGPQAIGFNPATSGPAWKLPVRREGMYRLTCPDLRAAGFPVDTVDLAAVHLYENSVEVRIKVSGASGPNCTPGFALEFYGRPQVTRASTENFYWLTVGAQPGLRMNELSALPNGAPAALFSRESLRIEQDKVYSNLRVSGPDQDHWYWTVMNPTSAAPPAVFTTTVMIPDPAAPLSATLTGLLRGAIACPAQQASVFVNHHPALDTTWPADSELAFSLPITATDFVAGANILNVAAQLPGSNPACPPAARPPRNVFYLNRFDLQYNRLLKASGDALTFSIAAPGDWTIPVEGFSVNQLDVFDVSDPRSPFRLIGSVTGGSGGYRLEFGAVVTTGRRFIARAEGRTLTPDTIRYHAPSGLRSPANAADYILITHSSIMTDVLPLGDLHAAEGLRVKVIDVQDVYDEFSSGRLDPQAIHDFLKYAYDHWQPPAPAYVLLAGDGHYDYLNNLGTNEPILIPPYLADVDPFIRETAADNRFVTLTPGDTLPDMAIGRLPVKTRTDAQAVVAKIIAYSRLTTHEAWTRRALFVADNADQAGDFAALSDKILNNSTPGWLSGTRAYYSPTIVGPGYYNTIANARNAVINGINGGALLVSYVGHGSVQTWAGERLLGYSSTTPANNDLTRLTNTGMYPFMVPMTCLEGTFFYPTGAGGPDQSALEEALLRAADRGAIGSFSATGLGIASGHDILETGLFMAFMNQGMLRLGDATTFSKLYLAGKDASGVYQDLMDTFLLLGDPALKLAAPQAIPAVSLQVSPAGSVRPGETVTYTLRFTNSGSLPAGSVTISNTLPAQLLNAVVVSAPPTLTLQNSSRYIWTVNGPLLPGQGGIIRVSAQTDPAARIQISSTAIITFTNAGGGRANGLATATIPLGWPFFLPGIWRR